MEIEKNFFINICHIDSRWLFNILEKENQAEITLKLNASNGDSNTVAGKLSHGEIWKASLPP